MLCGAAVELCGLLDHINILLGAHSGHGAVVAYAHEKTPSVVVGESADGVGYLGGIGYGELEVLVFMLPLLYKPVDIVAAAYGLYIFHAGYSVGISGSRSTSSR